MYLSGADEKKYEKVVAELNNSYITGQKNYPETVEDMINLLSLCHGDTKKKSSGAEKATDSESLETSFAQRGGFRQLSRIRCYNCNGTGHIAKNCPRSNDTDSEEATSSFTRQTGWSG